MAPRQNSGGGASSRSFRPAISAQVGSTKQRTVMRMEAQVRATGNREKVKMASLMDCKRYRGPKVAHKCPLCGGHRNYVENNGVAGYSTRLMDCMDEYKQIYSPEKVSALGMVRGCMRCTSWKHMAGICQQRFLPLSSSKALGRAKRAQHIAHSRVQ